MVLSAPAAHDPVPPSEADWIEQIRLSLRLGEAQGALVHVDRAVPERLGDLVRRLIGEHPEIDVHTDLRALETAPAGSTVVLLPRSEDAGALNLGRPLLARRRLRVVLWCDRETTVALAQNAPDFFDWISENYDCPPGPVPHAVAGLRAAHEAGAPGIVWRGTGDKDDVERLLRAFLAAFPEEKLAWVDPKRDYEDLLASVREAGKAWIACPARAASHVRRIRWAMAEAKRRGQAILMTDEYACPGWWPVHARLMPFEEARRTLEDVGARQPGALAALTGLEPEAMELSRRLLERGTAATELVERLRETSDPGAALGSMVVEDGPKGVQKIARAPVSPPVARAFATSSEVKLERSAALDAIRVGLATGRRVNVEDIGVLVSSRTLDGGALALMDVQALDYAIEARLRSAPVQKMWAELAQRALLAGEVDAAAVWALRVTKETWSSDDDMKALAERLAILGDRRAALLKASLSRDDRFVRSAAMVALVVSVVTAFRERSFAVGLVDFSIAWVVCYSALRLLYDSVRELIVRVGTWTSHRAASDRFQSVHEHVGKALSRGEYREVIEHVKGLLSGAQDGGERLVARRAVALLAHAYVEYGDDESARAELQQAVALEGRIAGVDAPPFLVLVSDLASALTHTGRARDAEALLCKLLGSDLLGSVPAEDLPRGLASCGAPEADEPLQRFLALPTIPPLSPEQRATALRLLAEAWIVQGRYHEAERLLECAAESPDASLPPDHPERRRTLAAYGRVLFFQRRPEQAEAVLRRALALAEQHAGPRHPDTGRILALLARVEHHLGRPEAPATARRALEVYASAQLSDAEKTAARGELEPIAAS